MAGSRDLYELIGTLNKTEKRYCRMMLESGTGRKACSCLRLFEILCAMEEPTEAAVRVAVEGEPFAGHLAVTKNHLYEHLLRSLRTFSNSNPVRARITSLTEGARILMERGLYEQARGRLCDARELAERHGYVMSQLNIEYLEYRIDVMTGHSGVDIEQIWERRRRVDIIVKDIGNLWDHYSTSAIVSREMLRYGQDLRRNEEDASELTDGTRRFYEQVVRPLEELPPPSSPAARTMYMDTLRMFYMLTARYEKGYAHSVECLRFLESYPVDHRIEQFNYISLLHNHAALSIKMGRYDEAREALKKLSELEPRSRFSQRYQAQLLFAGRVELLMVDLDHEAIGAMRNELERLCIEEERSFAKQMRICYAGDLAYAQLANGLAREAAQTIHVVINDHRPGYRDDQLCVARLIQLMIHYDLGDFELLPYLIRSTYRFISRCRGLSEVDRIVLRFMRRLPNMTTRDELTTELLRVRDELGAAPPAYDVGVVQAILPWLESKITGRPFGELAREAFRGTAIEIPDEV